VKVRLKFTRRAQFMNSPNAVAKAPNTSSVLSQTDTPGEEAAKHAPTSEEIRQRAFEIHCEQGGIHGCDLDDWLQAEHELLEKHKTSEEANRK
jgi:hypothetical protein